MMVLVRVPHQPLHGNVVLVHLTHGATAHRRRAPPLNPTVGQFASDPARSVGISRQSEGRDMACGRLEFVLLTRGHEEGGI